MEDRGGGREGDGGRERGAPAVKDRSTAGEEVAGLGHDEAATTPTIRGRE